MAVVQKMSILCFVKSVRSLGSLTEWAMSPRGNVFSALSSITLNGPLVSTCYLSPRLQDTCSWDSHFLARDSNLTGCVSIWTQLQPISRCSKRSQAGGEA